MREKRITVRFFILSLTKEGDLSINTVTLLMFFCERKNEEPLVPSFLLRRQNPLLAYGKLSLPVPCLLIKSHLERDTD